MPTVKEVSVRTFDAELKFTIHSNTTTHDLLEFVSKTIGVREIALFGLRYKDRKGFLTWMRLNKKVLSHEMGKQSPIVLHYAVRFFPEKVEREMRTEGALQLLFLQVQSALLNEEITCSPDIAALLASYTCQAAMGDYNNDKPKLRGEKLLPKSLASKDETTVPMICSLWKKHRGMDRSTAMLEYLKCAEQLEMYGVNYYKVRSKKGSDIFVGIHSKGMFINEKAAKEGGDTSTEVRWSEVRKVDVRDKKLTIKLADSKKDNTKRPSIYLQGESRRKIKHIYGLCLGNHELFCRRRFGGEGRVIGKSMSEVMEGDLLQEALSKPTRDGEDPKRSLSDDEGEENATPRPVSCISEDSVSSHDSEEKPPVLDEQFSQKTSEPEFNGPTEGYLLMEVNPTEEDPNPAKDVEDDGEDNDSYEKSERDIDTDKVIEEQMNYFRKNSLPPTDEQIASAIASSDEPETADVLSKVKAFEDLFQDDKDIRRDEGGDNRDDYIDENIVREEKNVAVVESEDQDYFDRIDQADVEQNEEPEAAEEDEDVEEEEEEEEEIHGSCKSRKKKDEREKAVRQAYQRFNNNAGEPNDEQRRFELELSQRAESPSFFQQFLAKAKKGLEELFSFGSGSDKKEEKTEYSGDKVDECFESEEYVPDHWLREDYFDIIDAGEDPDLPALKKEDEEEDEPPIVVTEAPDVQAEITDKGFFDDFDDEEDRIFAKMEAKKRQDPVVEENLIMANNADANVESENTKLFNGFHNFESEDKGKDTHQRDFEKHRHNLEIMERMSNFESEVKKAMEAIERCEDIVRRVEELQKKTDDKMTNLTYL